MEKLIFRLNLIFFCMVNKHKDALLLKLVYIVGNWMDGKLLTNKNGNCL
jgi:hypothetical protein